MKKSIVLNVFISLVLMLCSNVFALDLSAKFVDSEYNYSIKYPQDWNARINRSGVVLADINSNDNRAGLQIRIINSKESFDDYVKKYIERFEQDMQARLISQEYCMIDSRKAYFLSFSANRSGKDYFLLSYIIPANRQPGFFVFQAGVPYGLRNQIVPVIDAIAGSFQLN